MTGASRESRGDLQRPHVEVTYFEVTYFEVTYVKVRA
jgi:hypothetical protein